MRHGAFAIIVVGICLAAYAGLLALGRSPAYCALSHSYFDAAPCYQTDVRGQSADVLLVGDSSLLYGIRPSAVAAAGGGRVYNLGLVGPSFAFQPEAVIEAYRARNARPKAIIMYFAPWDVLTNARIADPQWAPLAIHLLRHGSWGELAHFIALRPAALVELPPLFVRNLLPPGPRAASYRGALEAEHGYLDYGTRGERPLAAECKPGRYPLAPGSTYAADNAAAVARLKRRYAAEGIPLYVYVAPTARCDGRIAAVHAAYAGVADNVPVALPDPLFADDSPYATHVHPSAAGVEAFSQELANFIRTSVASEPGHAAR